MFISMRSVCAYALGAALLLGVASELSAQGRGGGGRGGGRGGGDGAAAPAPTPESLQAYRVATMQQFQSHVAGLRAALAGSAGTPTHVLGHASALQQLAMMASDIFPAGSAGEGSRALPAIWENPSEFSQRVTALQSAANNLVAAARRGDSEGVNTALTSFNQSCGGCHTLFRGPPGY